jgi:hypothetical protein
MQEEKVSSKIEIGLYRSVGRWTLHLRKSLYDYLYITCNTVSLDPNSYMKT